jgi:hypothetical protein
LSNARGPGGPQPAIKTVNIKKTIKPTKPYRTLFFVVSIGIGGSIHALKCQETHKLNLSKPSAG